MNYICKWCMQWVYCRASAAYPCYLWQARKKKANLATLKSFFFRESYIWEPKPAFPFFYHHSLFLYSISPRLASPPSSLLLLSFLSLFVLTFFLYTLTPTLFCSFFCSFFLSSLPLRFPVPRFLSLGEFWITEAFWCQTATILHVNKKDSWRHSGSSTGTFFSS